MGTCADILFLYRLFNYSLGIYSLGVIVDFERCSQPRLLASLPQEEVMMSFFEAFPFLDGPEFLLFLIGCGFFLRLGALLLDWFIGNVRWLWRRLRKPC